MIAIVTDKPNVGREIARVLGADRKENGYMTGNGYMVTWTYGNMLSLAMPKDSGTSWVEREDFPLLPPPFLTVRHVKTDTGWNPDINAVLQLKVIAKVFDACDTIIAATDASREGEMLFRYLYRFLGCKQPCLRLWISSLTDEAITRGMENLRPCALFDNLFLAADSRNKADWLLGVNSSYAVCKAVGFGNNSLGRVQTPVLAAISGRYRERENHIPADSWPVFISLCKNGKIMKMRHVEDLGNRRDALELYEDCKAAGYARVTAVGSRTEEIGAPALYNLTELQKDANRYHNLTAIRVPFWSYYLYPQGCNFHKGIDGLCGEVIRHTGSCVSEQSCHIFPDRSRSRLHILYRCDDEYRLECRRLNRSSFLLKKEERKKDFLQISWNRLNELLTVKKYRKTVEK